MRKIISRWWRGWRFHFASNWFRIHHHISYHNKINTICFSSAEIYTIAKTIKQNNKNQKIIRKFKKKKKRKNININIYIYIFFSSSTWLQFFSWRKTVQSIYSKEALLPDPTDEENQLPRSSLRFPPQLAAYSRIWWNWPLENHYDNDDDNDDDDDQLHEIKKK